MRKTLTIAALVVGLAVAAVTPAVAATRPDVPMCLISDAGHGGRFTKSLTCVELLDQGLAVSGSGKYGPGDQDVHTLTVTVEYARPSHGWVMWRRLTEVTRSGTGELTAVTPPVRAPRFAQLRACVETAPRHRLCTA